MTGFFCAICQRQICLRWNPRGRGSEIAPICRYCEGEYTRGVGAPTHGSFRDRREVMRLGALAEALRSLATRKEWERRHGH